MSEPDLAIDRQILADALRRIVQMTTVETQPANETICEVTRTAYEALEKAGFVCPGCGVITEKHKEDCKGRG